jgi:FdhE protein
LLPAIALQQQLVQLTLDAAEQIDQPLPATLSSARVLEKWRRGLPALRNEEVPIPEFLSHLLRSFCTALAEGGAGDSVLHIRDALVDGYIDAGSLLSVSLARNRKAMRTSALHMGFSPDLMWLVGELGSSPLAHHLQVQLLAGLKAGATTVRSADLQVGITEWDRGYCPFCGSWPVFIESRHGSQELRCSFCALGWALQSHRCIYCGNSGDNFIAAAPDVSRARHRVELCGKCACYTKVIEVPEPTPFPLLAIEDLASIGLDHGAMERQYGRPDLYDLDSVEPLKSC